MKDWKSIAHSLAVEPIDDGTLAPLVALESTFRPLVAQLKPTDDVAVDYAAVLERGAE